MGKTMVKREVPSFDVSREDADLIHQIAKKAATVADKYECDYSLLDFTMDLTACHANGTPLLLAELNEAAPVDFCHDVFGIRRHIDRTTGKLQDCFLPRYFDSKAKGRAA